MLYHNTLVLAFLAAFSSALPSLTPSIRNELERGVDFSSTPIPPRQDPFYTAPGGFEHTSPGTVLRLRHAPGNLTSITGNCSAAYNVIYRTTDSQYKPAWALTTIYIPSNPSTSPGTALLSYSFPYNSVDLDSSPSFSVYSSPLPDVGPALSLGWFVNVPDFEGPLASNVAGIFEAHATIDSLRAILSLAQTLGLSLPQKSRSGATPAVLYPANGRSSSRNNMRRNLISAVLHSAASSRTPLLCLIPLVVRFGLLMLFPEY
jgi:hypothetical protein